MDAFQATVEKILDDGSIEIFTNNRTDTEIIPPLYYGGVTDNGVFCNPSRGDTILCVRVHPGSKGVTQAIRVLPKEDKTSGSTGVNDDSVPIDSAAYPKIKDGSLAVLSKSGSGVKLDGAGLNAGASITTNEGSGLYVKATDLSSFATSVSTVYQNLNAAGNSYSGHIIRGSIKDGAPDSQADAAINSDIKGYAELFGGERPLYGGSGAQDSAMLGGPRNPLLSESRTVVNWVAAQSAFTGWDAEFTKSESSGFNEFTERWHKGALDPRTCLSLAPHQLIEVIAGNVVSSRGDVLDVNYGILKLGDAEGRPIIKEESYEKDARLNARSLGYHFQLSTNYRSQQRSNDVDNFIFAIDKQGCLKVNVPKNTSYGNVSYPTKAEFGHETGGVKTNPLKPSESEPIPVTLRDKFGNVVTPKIPAKTQMNAAGGVPSRGTGIRFVNDDGYFQGEGFKAEDGNKVRVNFTAHHNMYAAAEMLIANTVTKIWIPENGAACPDGLVTGTAIGKPFELPLGDVNGAGALEAEKSYMSTVVVSPKQPAMDAGGGVVVAGKGRDDQSEGSNKPFSNSFNIAGESGSFSEELLANSSGGKSANINFEGAVDVSVGRDSFDKKSLVLDTAGSLVAWLGMDKSKRSLVLQTDGDVAINVGGRSFYEGKSQFRAGRFDLRVNVTDKGLSSKPGDGEDGFRPKNGPHASDFVISISPEGLVIAGMKPGANMVIRNDGPLALESTAKLSLAGNSVEIKEGHQVARKTHKAPTSQDQKAPDLEEVTQKIECITKVLSNLTDS